MAIKKVLERAPRTKLFVTGYPAFWNHDTDYCDKKSFKLNCPNNSVLPLTKEKRLKMNQLTDKLNAKIKSIVDNWPTHADLIYVDVNSKFGGHRFCEKDVEEPSYRNSKIWFYPLEYVRNVSLIRSEDVVLIYDYVDDRRTISTVGRQRHAFREL